MDVISSSLSSSTQMFWHQPRLLITVVVAVHVHEAAYRLSRRNRTTVCVMDEQGNMAACQMQGSTKPIGTLQM